MIAPLLLLYEHGCFYSLRVVECDLEKIGSSGRNELGNYLQSLSKREVREWFCLYPLENSLLAKIL